MNILITYFSNKTEKEWRDANVLAYYSSQRSHLAAAGSVIVAINKDTNTIIHVSVAAGPCRARTLTDRAVYTGVDAEFNNYIVPLRSLRSVNISLAEVARVCAIPVECKGRANIHKCTQYKGFCRPFYHGSVAGAMDTYTAYIKGLAYPA